MSLSFLGKKSFHPSNPRNLKKLFQAEEAKAGEERKAEGRSKFGVVLPLVGSNAEV